MKKIILMLVLLPSLAQAKFVLSGGPELSGGIDDSAVESFALIGLRGEVEYGHKAFPNVTVFGNVSYLQGPGRTQYDYKDPNDQSVTQISDVKTKVSLTRLSTGLRFKLIDQKNLFFFAAGGLQFGALNLNLDRSNFKGKALVTDDFEQNEHQNLLGYFGELGGELSLNSDFGIRLSAHLSQFRTQSFEILSDSEVESHLVSIAVSYVWYL